MIWSSPKLLPILLLVASNVFMTLAWYGHLKFKASPLWLAVVASWSIAFVEYCFAVPATHRDGQRLRKRYGKVRSHLFTFLDHPEVPADNNSSERELRHTATYRKVTGGVPLHLGR